MSGRALQQRVDTVARDLPGREECGSEREVALGRRAAAVVEPAQRVAQHRVAEAVGGGGELGADGQVDAAEGDAAVRAQRSRAEQHGQELVVGDGLQERSDLGTRGLVDVVATQPRIGGLDLVGEAVVLAREDRVHRRERHVLVGPDVSGEEQVGCGQRSAVGIVEAARG